MLFFRRPNDSPQTLSLGDCSLPKQPATATLLNLDRPILEDIAIRIPRIDLDGENVFQLFPRPPGQSSPDDIMPRTFREATYRYTDGFHKLEDLVSDAQVIAGTSFLAADARIRDLADLAVTIGRRYALLGVISTDQELIRRALQKEIRVAVKRKPELCLTIEPTDLAPSTVSFALSKELATSCMTRRAFAMGERPSPLAIRDVLFRVSAGLMTIAQYTENLFTDLASAYDREWRQRE